VLRGRAPATVDAKGRVKIPAHYRQLIEEKCGRDFYVTSTDGLVALLYPLPVWLEIEQRLVAQANSRPSVKKFKSRLSYYGATTAMDRQGRVLIPAHLRQSARLENEVILLGQLNYLEIWNRKQLDERIDSQALTDEDLKVLADLGF